MSLNAVEISVFKSLKFDLQRSSVSPTQAVHGVAVCKWDLRTLAPVGQRPSFPPPSLPPSLPGSCGRGQRRRYTGFWSSLCHFLKRQFLPFSRQSNHPLPWPPVVTAGRQSGPECPAFFAVYFVF